MPYTPTTWNTGDTITASALNKIEQGIANAGGGGGGGKYDAYDFVITQVDNGTPVLEKGTWQDVYDALQDMEHVTGLYCWNETPGPYHDTASMVAPLTYVYYYSSADMICGISVYNDGTGKKVQVNWRTSGITVTKLTP